MESESEVFGKSSNRSSSSQERESPRKSSSSRSRRIGRETAEEAIIRRFHDAQRMARFRARKKKALEDKQPGTKNNSSESEARLQERPETESKYSQLLAIIERIGRDVRLSYVGSRSSAERLKSGIVRARGLVRDCLVETRINLRQ